jgi:hypothetical protein
MVRGMRKYIFMLIETLNRMQIFLRMYEEQIEHISFLQLLLKHSLISRMRYDIAK